jgi:hypothetical protein
VVESRKAKRDKELKTVITAAFTQTVPFMERAVSNKCLKNKVITRVGDVLGDSIPAMAICHL